MNAFSNECFSHECMPKRLYSLVPPHSGFNLFYRICCRPKQNTAYIFIPIFPRRIAAISCQLPPASCIFASFTVRQASLSRPLLKGNSASMVTILNILCTAAIPAASALFSIKSKGNTVCTA